MQRNDRERDASDALRKKLIGVPPLDETGEEHPRGAEQRDREIVSGEQHEEEEDATDQEDRPYLPMEGVGALQVENEERPELRAHEHRPVVGGKLVDERNLAGAPAGVGRGKRRIDGRLAHDRRSEDVPLVDAVPFWRSEQDAAIAAPAVESVGPDADRRPVNLEQRRERQEDEQRPQDR